DETLVRAVARCRTPVVSAIGHETDQPLLDFVADVAASTPTDAARRIVPDVAEETARITGLRQRAWDAVIRRIDGEQRRLRELRSRPVLAFPERDIDRRAREVEVLVRSGRRCLDAALSAGRDHTAHLLARLRALSPAATLQRGYAIVQDAAGHVVRDALEVGDGDHLGVRLSRGRLGVTVVEREAAVGTP
ncbi:MAG: exodeoxyribonuclease VII large subunit, partial [Acidothermus sp.]|nr:exodeoxyribonuclease VII large subunit [Acidothermus sp.]